MLACFLISIKSEAQQEQYGNPTAPIIFSYPDEAPKPAYALNQYIGSNLHYPDSAQKNNVEGKVVVKFIVNEDGRISDCVIDKSVSWDLDSEALRVIRNMPPWIPGVDKGKPVRVYFRLPINYKLVNNLDKK